MAEVNQPKGLTRTELIQLMNKHELTQSEKEIVLFNFDQADVGEQGVGTDGAGDKVLKGFELEYFYKLMGWNKEDDASSKQQQSVQSKSPESTGRKRAEYNPQDKTTLVYDYEDGTITKYDENNNVLGVTDMDGKPINSPTTPKPTPKKPTQPTQPNEPKPLTKEEINKSIDALKPGESYTYTESNRSSWGSGRYAEQHPVRWTRNQDGTLSRYIPQFDFSSKRSFMLETKYTDDRKHKISEEKLTRASSPFGAKATINYDENGQPVSERIPLSSNSKLKSMAFTKEGFLTSTMSHGKFSSQEIRDKNGNVILKCVNGEFTDAKGRTVSADKAYDIIEDAFNDGNINELIQNY